MLPVVRPFMKTPEQGAATSIYLASSPEVEGVTGRYFANSKPKTSSRASLRHRRGTRLWDVSADLVGLPEPDRPADATGPPERMEETPTVMGLGVHLVNFDLPGGPAAIGPTLARVGEAAERAGVDNLSAMDHYLQIAGMGVGGAERADARGVHHPRATWRRTPRPSSCSCSSPASPTGTRACSPRSSSTLDVLSGGRAALGIGAAWYEREHAGLRRALSRR